MPTHTQTQNVFRCTHTHTRQVPDSPRQRFIIHEEEQHETRALTTQHSEDWQRRMKKFRRSPELGFLLSTASLFPSWRPTCLYYQKTLSGIVKYLESRTCFFSTCARRGWPSTPSIRKNYNDLRTIQICHLAPCFFLSFTHTASVITNSKKK